MHERVETGPLGPPASVISVILATHRLLIATAAWVLFEYVVTLEEEIVIFWRRKWSPTSVLLLFIRWTLLLEAIFILLPQPSIQNCSSRVIMILVPVMVGSVQTSAFAALRVFAIWNRSYRLAIWVFVLGVVPCASHIYVLARSSAPIAFAGKEVFLCNQSRLLSGASNHIYAIVSRMPAIVSEGVVLALTFTKTYRWVRDNRRSSSSRSLAERLLRDGSLYFAVLLLINIAEIAFIFHPSSISGLATTLDIVPPILTARFIMDIHSVSGVDTIHDSTMGAGDDQNAQSLSAFDSSTLTALDDIGESSTIPGTWPRSAVP